MTQTADTLLDEHLLGLFAPQDTEGEEHGLPVEGQLPAALEGCYLRNGPNPRFAPVGPYLYPFDGDGMIHRVEINGGRASYRNRFVRTPALIAEEAAGRALWPGILGGPTPGADLVGPQLAHTDKDIPSVNVVHHAGRLMALAEAAPPFLLAEDLGTLGAESFFGMLPAGMSAHPKLDRATGELVTFRYGFEPPYLTWSVIDAHGVPTRVETPIPGVDRPSLIHDMALTPTYVVLILGPLFFPSLTWEPDQGTRVVLIAREGSGVTWFDTDPFWTWHTANACEDGGRVVIDYVRWSAPPGLAPVPVSGSLARLTLDPSTGGISQDVLVDRAMEFPRIDERAIGQPHPVIATSLKTGERVLPGGDFDALGWYETRTDRFATWSAGELAVGEQVHAPDPAGSGGWWLTLGTDRHTGVSRLLVISADEPRSGPVASVLLPRRVPLGLHGTWVPSRP